MFVFTVEENWGDLPQMRKNCMIQDMPTIFLKPQIAVRKHFCCSAECSICKERDLNISLQVDLQVFNVPEGRFNNAKCLFLLSLGMAAITGQADLVRLSSAASALEGNTLT